MLVKPPAAYAQGFYTKGFEWNGIWVMGNAATPDETVYRAAEIVFNSIAFNPAIVAQLAKAGARFVVIPEGTVLTDLPGYRHLPNSFDQYRGLFSFAGYPVSSSAVENILKLPSDPYNGTESIGLHEWMHAVENNGFKQVSPVLYQQFKNAYTHAMTTGLWTDTYAADNFFEYFAETAQSFFNDNPAVPVAHIHNAINTRAELKAYDVTAYNLLVKIFGLSTWTVGKYFGTDGNNSMQGTFNADLMFGNAGNDALFGSNGNDKLVGGLGKDFLKADNGNDVLEGDLGNDKLIGGGGNDKMTGGGHYDIFVFNYPLNRIGNVDTITDFSAFYDTIHLENLIFTKLVTRGVLHKSFFKLATAAKDGNDYIQYDKATGALVYDADGSGPIAGVQFAILANKPSITNADFVVI